MESLGSDTLDIKRELDVIYGYRIHKKLGKELYGSTLKLLEKNIFGKSQQYAVRKCGFSYNFKKFGYKGIKHDCIWINPKYEDNWDAERIKLQVKQDDKYSRTEILKIWENKIWFRSVKSIKHYHIIYIPKL